MRRAFVVPRNEVVGDSKHPQCIPNLEIIKKAGVPLKYQDEGILSTLYVLCVKFLTNL